jgi:hypothetical protein
MKMMFRVIFSLTIMVWFGGCATKVDLNRFRDVPLPSHISQNTFTTRVVPPKLSPSMTIDALAWSSYGTAMQSYFLANNERTHIFQLDDYAGDRLHLALHDLASTKIFTPSSYVPPPPKSKGRGYYTQPYWSYYVTNSITATVSLADGGTPKYFESSSSLSYTTYGNYSSEVPREKYLESLQNTLDNLLRDMANAMVPNGMIVAKKVAIDNEKEAIFMINMGNMNGLYPEQKVIIYKANAFNATLGGRLVESVKTATGRVSNQIMPHHAWIVLDNGDQNGAVEVGDIIRPIY